MIPIYPQFKKLELSDREIVQKHLTNFLPYSDYNFVSLWSYDTKQQIQISYLHENLIVRFQDYLKGQPFYSFLGTSEISSMCKLLIERSARENLPPLVKLIPEITVESLMKTRHELNIAEDMDNFDYILSIKELIEMKGNKFGPKRNFLNRFNRLHAASVETRIIDLTDHAIQKKIIDLFIDWEKMKNKSRNETTIELQAINRLFQGTELFKLASIGLFYRERLIGFSINEIVHNQYGIIHFEKADISYTGIFTYLKQQTAKYLSQQGCIYINYEQDLGIDGLRKAKLSYRPSHYFKKYTISRNQI